MTMLSKKDKETLSRLLKTTSSSIRIQDNRYIIYRPGDQVSDTGILVGSLQDALTFMHVYSNFYTTAYATVPNVTPVSLLDAPVDYIRALSSIDMEEVENTVSPHSSFSVSASLEPFDRSRLYAVASQLEHRAQVVATYTEHKGASIGARVLCNARRRVVRSIMKP